MRGTEDRTNIASAIDARSGLMVHSLYTSHTVPPPDSLLVGIQLLLLDLQDIGTRTWTYTGLMVYALRAAARNHLPMLVLDRPNPISGTRFEGPMLNQILPMRTIPHRARLANPTHYTLRR